MSNIGAWSHASCVKAQRESARGGFKLRELGSSASGSAHLVAKMH